MGSTSKKLPTSSQHRVDDAHPASDSRAQPHVCTAKKAGSGDVMSDAHWSSSIDRKQEFVEMQAAEATALENLLPEHAQDLIQKLQAWCNALDRREAELNARLAWLEHNERTSRLRDQSTATLLQEQERSMHRKRQQLQDEMRRLAVGNMNVSTRIS